MRYTPHSHYTLRPCRTLHSHYTLRYIAHHHHPMITGRDTITRSARLGPPARILCNARRGRAHHMLCTCHTVPRDIICYVCSAWHVSRVGRFGTWCLYLAILLSSASIRAYASAWYNRHSALCQHSATSSTSTQSAGTVCAENEAFGIGFRRVSRSAWPYYTAYATCSTCYAERSTRRIPSGLKNRCGGTICREVLISSS